MSGVLPVTSRISYTLHTRLPWGDYVRSATALPTGCITKNALAKLLGSHLATRKSRSPHQTTSPKRSIKIICNFAAHFWTIQLKQIHRTAQGGGVCITSVRKKRVI